MQGIAVILMFYHHFCGFPEWLSETSKCKSIIPVMVSGMSLMRIIAVFGTICVGIFTFCTGYYYFYNNRDNEQKMSGRLKKCFSLLLNYWVIMALYIIIAFIFSEPFPSVKVFLFNLFGMKLTANTEYVCVTFGWYIGFYIIITLLLPPIHKICDKHKCDILIVVGWILYFMVSRIVTLWTVFSNILAWGPIFSIGYFVAKYDLLGRQWGRNARYRACLSSVFLILIFGIKCVLGSAYKGFNLYILYTPLFVIALFYIIDALLKEDKKIVKIAMDILELLGKYSMNLWLLHGIFFTPKRSLQFIAYFPQYGLLITVWAIILLLPLSVGVGKVQKGIQKLFIKL